VMNEVIGTTVLTRYNNRTYKIDDIDWNTTPDFKFKKNGEAMSLIDYYKKHYNITIKDLKQPLLIHRYKQKTSTGEVC
jgi:aubergine-like protein